MQVGVTVGLAHAPLHGVTRDELTRRADLALRAAKRKRRGGMTVFDPAMDVEFNERRFIERELKRALADKAIDVHYQPIVSADGNRIVGAEALARWNHPVRGAIPPASFIPVAEQAGLMGQLGEFVLRRALSDAKRWPEPVDRGQPVAGAGARSPRWSISSPRCWRTPASSRRA